MDYTNNNNNNDDLKVGHFSSTPNIYGKTPNDVPIHVLPKPNTDNTAVQVIDFAKEQIAKITSAAVSGEGYSQDTVNGIMDVVKHLIDAAVRIEAINKLPSLNIDDNEIIKEIFTDAIFK
jgi:hypothetical protein